MRAKYSLLLFSLVIAFCLIQSQRVHSQQPTATPSANSTPRATASPTPSASPIETESPAEQPSPTVVRIDKVELHQALLDLTNLSTVMCVAAHPDDEDGTTL